LADYEFQMRVYADLYFQRNGRHPKKTIIYFVGELAGDPPPASTPAAAVMDVILERGRIDEALDAFDCTVQEIETSRRQNRWVPPPQGVEVAGKETCDLCDVRWSCPVEGPNYMRKPRYP